MAIPDYQSIMLPLLQLAADGHEHRFRDAVESLSAQFGLSAEERAQPLPSRTQPVFDNRVGWARTYLVKACLLESPRRAYFRITDRGREVLKNSPSRIDAAFLRANYEEFREFVYNYIEKEDTKRSLLFQVEMLRKAGFKNPVVLHKNICYAAFGAAKK